MTSLGKTLAKNIADELKNRVSPEETAEQKRQVRIRELAEVGKRFFAKAKQFFSEGIAAATPVDSLYLQIGGEGYRHADDYHKDIEAEMHGDIPGKGRFWFYGGDLPEAMTEPDRFAASWDEFKAWAASNELEAYWELGRGGAGGWWFLRIRPAVPSTQG